MKILEDKEESAKSEELDEETPSVV